MAAAGSTLSPLSHRLFMTLWIATLVANFGSLILAVGAQWTMTAIDGRADMVALIWAAMSLPMMLFSVVGGAVSDIHDRRRVLLAAYGAAAAVSALLVALSVEGMLTSWILVAATFAFGLANAFYVPATQASISAVVPRSELAGAANLNILGFNVARALGPALGGVIVAAAGESAAFLANMLAALAAAVMLLFWRPPPGQPKAGASILGSIAEGLRCVRDQAPIRAIVARAFVFTLTGSAAWALMPLVARDLVGGGAEQFGLLLGALGLGAVLGAAVSHEVRRRVDGERLIRLAALAYGLACMVVATIPGLAASLVALVIGGACWIQALSTFSVGGQVWSPRHAVGRVTATVNTMTFGGIALGSWLWGHVAERVGVGAAIFDSGAAMVLVVALGLVLPMPRGEGPEAQASS